MISLPNQVRGGVPAAAALSVIVAAAWVALAAGVGGHAAHDDVLGHGGLPDATTVAALLGGWLLMVAAMMLPPEIASAARPGVVVGTTAAVWTGFAVVALSGDALVHALAGPHGHHGGLADLIASAVLVGAGVFQLSAVRRRLLTAARDPSLPPWRHALCCLGGCWALMLVMFAVGVGSLALMAVLTVVMTAERVAGPRVQTLLGPLTGVALVGAGAVVGFA